MSNQPQSTTSAGAVVSIIAVTSLTYAMFFMFAMTTDAVGEIIKIAKVDMQLTNVQASAFHWATMVAIAASGIGLGFLADRFGRKTTIIGGLTVYGLASMAFVLDQRFELYLILLFISGLAIGVFKTAALALVGDIANSTEDHTSKMNAVEGFFGIGAIIGPMLVVWFASRGISWTWLYVIAALLCATMILIAIFTKYPDHKRQSEEPASLMRGFSLMKNQYAMGFSMAIALYVACEVAIFVWLPSLLANFSGEGLSAVFAAYAVMIFFILRAIGRFLGAFVLRIIDWKIVMLLFSGAIFLCFAGSAWFGQSAVVFLLPLSGIFMSMMYPTLNSKGISCLPKADHGAVAGLILFFTAVSAAFAPLAMALVADGIGGGDMKYGFYLATGAAACLFAMTAWNWLTDPAAKALSANDSSEYSNG
mgnify:FL=1